MTMHLVLGHGGRWAEVELAVDDPAATVADLTSGVDGDGGHVGLLVGDRWFGPDVGLDEVPLFEGALVELTERPATSTRTPERSPRLVLAVIGGPGAGRTYAIDKPAMVIGRDPACDIVIDDPSLSRHHAQITARGEILDLGSTNGTWLDDIAIVAPTTVPPGALLRMGATQLRVRTTETGDRPAGLPSGTFVPFNRPPRPASRPAPEPLVAPEAPKQSTSSRAFGIAMIVGPILMGAGMVVIYGNPRFALFAALAPVIALVNWVAGKRSTRKDRRRRDRAFAAELAQFDCALTARAAGERIRLDDAHVDAAEVLRRATLPSVTMWQRRPDHDDFLHLRAGTGSVPWIPAVPGGRDAPPAEVADLLERHRLLTRAPVMIDLANGGVVGIVGNRDAALALARSLVCQAGVHHGPADLDIAVVGDAEWDWTKWIPHLAQDALSGDERERALLVVVDDVASLEGRRAPVRQLLQRSSGIVVAPTEDQLPAMCSTIVAMRSDLGDAEVRRPQDRVHLHDVHIGGMDDATARLCARSIARYEDPELELAGTALPDVVRLVPLLGIDDMSPDSIRAMWARGGVDPAPATPIGVGDDGIMTVDLVADGPHGLIGGTTGSGKSELLRSLVAGMAARVEPEHLVFVLVDYKGGSAFDDCARLPHVVGLVTDLDEQLAERALRSLEAELRHRERVLRTAGAPDLSCYLAAGSPRGPLPRLVVVIDEFATMANELPDFLGALVGIAQRGRSLGVHLLLATQRPSGAVNANIKANTNLRIALRVQDGNDSSDIIDRPSASAISRTTPGRAYVRRGPTDVELVQTALATAPCTDDRHAPVRVRPFRLAHDGEVEQASNNDISELSVLVDAIERAWMGRPAPRRPWLPALPERVTRDELAGAPDGLVAFALADEPDHQRQVAAGWTPADGHLALFGMVGSGTTTAVLAVVDTLARRYDPSECQIYGVDFGANGLAAMRPIPHVGALITAGEREAQGRLIRHLQAEVERRRATGASSPRIVTCIDGIGPFLAEHDSIESAEMADAFRRVFSEGPGVGIQFVVTGDRVGALPLRLASLVSQKLLFRLADTADYATVGLRPAQLPRFVPGRAVHSEGNRVVQVAVPDLRDIEGIRVAPSIGTLPSDVPFHALPAARVASNCVIPIGIGDDDLAVADLRVHSGDHILVTGPPRSGKTNALALMARALRNGSSDVVLTALCTARSPLQQVDAFDAVGTIDELVHVVGAAATDDRTWFVFIDDATTLDDPDGLIAALLQSGRPGLHVVAAARVDDVRAAYGHWLRLVRQSRTGLLLQPDLAADGDLLGVRLPRRLPVPLVPGRGFVVENGDVALLQTGNAQES